MKIQEIDAVLTRMSELLNYGEFPDWAALLEKLRGELKDSPDNATVKISALFGGSGSLNDIVLYRNGQPLRQENDELDALRSRLFSLCRH
jgi:hypothetical protein